MPQNTEPQKVFGRLFGPGYVPLLFCRSPSEKKQQTKYKQHIDGILTPERIVSQNIFCWRLDAKGSAFSVDWHHFLEKMSC